jgi:hypothetical protein
MTKLSLKVADIEIEYEGSEEFLQSELPKLIEGIARLASAKGKDKSENQDPDRETRNNPALPDRPGGELSISTISQRLGVSKGSELIMAAALSLVGAGAESFTKAQLRDRAREAKSYWKSTYRGNFDSYVARLVKAGRLNHNSGDNYALPDKERNALSTRIKVEGKE